MGRVLSPPATRTLARIVLSTLGLLLAGEMPGVAQTQAEPRLGPAPRLLVSAPATSHGTADASVASVASVDTTNRTAVADLYNTVFLPALAVPNAWTGSVADIVVERAIYADAPACAGPPEPTRSRRGYPDAVLNQTTSTRQDTT